MKLDDLHHKSDDGDVPYTVYIVFSGKFSKDEKTYYEEKDALVDLLDSDKCDVDLWFVEDKSFKIRASCKAALDPKLPTIYWIEEYKHLFGTRMDVDYVRFNN